MTEFIRNIIGNDFIATLIMSFVPLIELKGGIIFARGLGYGIFSAFGLAYLGSILAFFPIYFLLRPVLALLKKIKWFNRFACNVEGYFAEKAEVALKNQALMGKKETKTEKHLKQLGVFIFVAIPLPMTGIWAGTGIAVFLDLKFKDAILPILLGNMVAGIIISILAAVCTYFWSIAVLDYILYALFFIALLLMIIVVVGIVTKKSKHGEEK